ncbi:MAG: hypothetical protein KC931_24980, partial [Candidatus Omnitrophica bacterium]|nr:hypothetical protein [Candidatus Omnitrophota bacterium]
MKRIDAEEAASEAAILAYGDRFLETFPLGWFLVSLAGFSEHPLKFGLSWFWSVIFTFAFVPAFLLSLIREPFERLLAFHPDLSVLQRSTASEPVWEKYERKLRHSEHEAPDPNDTSLVIREADHLLLGFDPWTDYPILLHRPLIDDSHVYIGGGTGSGKTTRAMVSLFTPLIRPRTDRKGQIEPMPPMVIIDLKGDDTLLEKVMVETEKRAEMEGRPMRHLFRYFTTEGGHPTNRFNPFPTFKGDGTSQIQLVQTVLDALSVNYGPGYGMGYYSSRNRSLLQDIVRKHDPHSFREIYGIL